MLPSLRKGNSTLHQCITSAVTSPMISCLTKYYILINVLVIFNFLLHESSHSHTLIQPNSHTLPQTIRHLNNEIQTWIISTRFHSRYIRFLSACLVCQCLLRHVKPTPSFLELNSHLHPCTATATWDDAIFIPLLHEKHLRQLI